MHRSSTNGTTNVGRLALLILFLGLQSTARAENASGLNYPAYEIDAFCQNERSVRATGRLYDCEDRDQAVAILLKAQWETLQKEEPALIEICKVNEGYSAHRPSYTSLLQCITRIHDAAD